MTEKQREAAYKEIAARYLEEYGSSLHQELAELNKAPPYNTTRLDSLVKTGISKKPGRNPWQPVLLVAAMAAVVGLVVWAIPKDDSILYNGDMTMASSAAMDESATSEAAQEALPEEAPADAPETAADAQADVQEPETGGGPMTGGDSGAASSWAADKEVPAIPISFELPANLWVQDAEQDVGQSVYYLGDTGLDDVVMTMELSDELYVRDDLEELTLGDDIVYGVSYPEYNLLTFQKEDIVYTLTCKYDAETILSLGESILM